MDIIDPRIDEYLTKTLAVDNPILREMGEYGVSRNFPIIGPQVGRLLYLLTRSINAKRVLELGSGFGYSAMWFALAVGEGGQVVMTEASKENVDRARDYFARARLLDRVVFNVGDALEIGRRLDTTFDVILNDIDKQDYPKVLDIARARVRERGYFISDNMLRRGIVLERKVDAETRGIQELTMRLMQARDWFTTILPVRDGVSVSLRIENNSLRELAWSLWHS